MDAAQTQSLSLPEVQEPEMERGEVVKIGTPLPEPPERKRSDAKYKEIWLAVEAAKGSWIPVEMDSKIEAFQLMKAARQHAGLHVKKRGVFVYISLEPTS